MTVLAAFGAVGFYVVSTRESLRNPALWARPQSQSWWSQRHNAKVAEAKQRAGQVDLLFVGDSITQNYERAESPACLDFLPIWNELFAPHRAMNLGFNADRTGNVLWRLRHGEVDGLAPRDIVLLIGTNNLNPSRLHRRGESAAQVSAGIMAVVAELHRRMPAARILVLSLLPTNFSADRTAKANAINAEVKTEVERLPYAHWLDVTGIFLDGQRVRSDLYYDALLWPGSASVHPTAAGQRLMAEAVAGALWPSQPSAQ
jgi:lysophospholipase L1-like esterase